MLTNLFWIIQLLIQVKFEVGFFGVSYFTGVRFTIKV